MKWREHGERFEGGRESRKESYLDFEPPAHPRGALPIYLHARWKLLQDLLGDLRWLRQ